MPKQTETTHADLSRDEIQAIARALAEPRRFAILQQIAGQERTACGSLHAQEEISAATISHHLKELEEAGLIGSERCGRSVSLWLRRDVWSAYLRYLQAL